MSARPGRIIDDITIDLARPRNLDTLADSKFADICNALRRRFQATMPT
jgi:NitT/TauT family transport system ATP-binding protein